jgi:NADH pyrophosphatase NudC (nudix superfamily)
MICPDCGSTDIIDHHDERFPTCEDCGHVFYDEWTLAIIAEVKREQAQCKQILGYTPTYSEAVEKGLVKP